MGIRNILVDVNIWRLAIVLFCLEVILAGAKTSLPINFSSTTPKSLSSGLTVIDNISDGSTSIRQDVLYRTSQGNATTTLIDDFLSTTNGNVTVFQPLSDAGSSPVSTSETLQNSSTSTRSSVSLSLQESSSSSLPPTTLSSTLTSSLPSSPVPSTISTPISSSPSISPPSPSASSSPPSTLPSVSSSLSSPPSPSLSSSLSSSPPSSSPSPPSSSSLSFTTTSPTSTTTVKVTTFPSQGLIFRRFVGRGFVEINLFSAETSVSSIATDTPSSNSSLDSQPSADIYYNAGWVAGPAIGGILGLSALFASAYLVGKKRREGSDRAASRATGHQSFNENRTFVSDGAERFPEAVEMKDFPAYVDELHDDLDKKFNNQYQMLVKLTPHYERAASELPQNRNKNRYANILPYDASRVKLVSYDEDQSTDYINASYIPGHSSQREYIAAQGPLTTTLADFWRMIWEQNVSSVVMLTDLREEGRDKCAKYWPSKGDVYEDESLCYGDVQVRLSSESSLAHYVVRMLKAQLVEGEVCRTVCQYHFLDWKENPTMGDVENFLNFARDVRSGSSGNAPILVHCSSGAGRTGTFILVDRTLRGVDAGQKIDMFGTTMKMREHRTLMVQNEGQYIFAHEVVRRAVEEKLFGALHHGFVGFDEIA